MNSRWNSTEAYDLSLYEVPAEPAKRPQPVPVAKNKAQSKKAAQRGAMRRLTACAVLVVVFLAMVLYQNVSTIELGNEIQTQNDLYAALQDEYSYLSGKLTAKTAVHALTVIIAVVLIGDSVTVGILQSCISEFKPKVLQL